MQPGVARCSPASRSLVPAGAAPGRRRADTASPAAHPRAATNDDGSIDGLVASLTKDGVAEQLREFAADIDLRWTSGARYTLGGATFAQAPKPIIRDALLVRKNREGVVERLSRKDWDSVLAVNLTGATMMAQEVLVNMLERDATGGVIINIGSTAGIRPRPGLSWYNASKGAVNVLTKSMAVELAPENIRVNLDLAFVLSPMKGKIEEKIREELKKLFG